MALVRTVSARYPTVTLDLPSGALWTMGEQDGLSRVLANLLDNAVRYAKSSVLVSVSGSRDTCLVTVTDDEMRAAEHEMGASEGMFVCPEGAATWAGAKNLVAGGRLDPRSRVVLFNTGTGFKYWGQR